MHNSCHGKKLKQDNGVWLSQNTSCVSILNVFINHQKSIRLILVAVIVQECFIMITESIPQDMAILNAYIAKQYLLQKI